MAQVIWSTTSQGSDASTSSKTLLRTLDDLLERYLNLLHEYQAQQKDVATGFSSGFLSLAQANFSGPSRTRYGQDLYDDRMQASCQINVSSSHPAFSIRTAQATGIGIDIGTVEAEQGSAQASGPSSVPQIDAKVAESHHVLLDPLKWFGVLSPPALRSSQQSFKLAVHKSIPQLANIVNEMKLVEIEIRRARKKLTKVR